MDKEEALPVDYAGLVLDDKATEDEMDYEWTTIFWAEDGEEDD